MFSYIIIILFGAFAIFNFKEYKKTKETYKLLTLIPIMGVILLETPIKQYISQKTDITITLIILILYISIVMYGRINKRGK